MPFPARSATAVKKKPTADDAANDAVVAKKKPVAKRVAAPKPPALTAKQKAKLVAFKAPSDFKPASFEFKFITQHDGLIHPKIFGERIRGRWENPEAKRYNMAEYDAVTLAGVLSRLQASFYSSNFHRRMPPKERFSLVLRVTKKADDAQKDAGMLSVRVQAAAIYVYSEKTEKWKAKWFDFKDPTDKADPTLRKIKRAGRLLRGAFVNVQLPPAGRQPKKAEAEE